MADAYTPNLGLTLMENGTHNNTWNDEFVSNDERIDAKLGDVTTVNSTGGTTVLSGSQERVNVVRATGVLASAKTIEFSGVGGAWVIENATTGAFGLTCKVTGQTGISVSQGQKVFAFFNGTDLAVLSAETAANLGLGTGDSPQFAGLNIGHATDSTIARIAAGRIGIEGQELAKLSAVGMVKLASGTISSATAALSVNLAAFTADGYHAYKIIFNLLPATDNVLLKLRTSTNGGSSYDAGASDYSVQGITAGVNFADGAADAVFLTDITTASASVGNAANEGVWGEITIHRPNDAKYGRVSFHAEFIEPTGGGNNTIGGGRRLAAANIDAFRLLFSSGNIASGDYTVLGIR